MDELLTPKELCKIYNISIFTLYKWTSLGLIPHIKLKRTIRFRESDLAEWEEQQKAALTPTTKLL